MRSGKVKSSPEYKLSMREIAYQHIGKKIASRILRAGDPVSELPIANELGISRTPTREAVRQLVAEGLLEEVPGRGVVVVTLERRDIVEIYEVRKALEVQAVQMAARHLAGSADHLKNLRQVAERMESLIKELERSGQQKLDFVQSSRFEAADIGFHSYLMQAAGNRRIMKLTTGLRSLVRIFAMHKTGHTLETVKRVHGDHCDVIAAIEAGDPVRAAGMLAAHIETGELERLKQFDQREQEAGLPQDIPAFLDRIQAQLN